MTSLFICVFTAKWGEQFFLTIKFLQSCEGDLLCESSEQPCGSPGSSMASAGLDTRRAQIFICFCMYSAAKCGFEGTVLVLRGVLDAEGNFWLLLTCCEIRDIRRRTNITEHQWMKTLISFLLSVFRVDSIADISLLSPHPVFWAFLKCRCWRVSVLC